MRRLRNPDNFSFRSAITKPSKNIFNIHISMGSRYFHYSSLSQRGKHLCLVHTCIHRTTADRPRPIRKNTLVEILLLVVLWTCEAFYSRQDYCGNRRQWIGRRADNPTIARSFSKYVNIFEVGRARPKCLMGRHAMRYFGREQRSFRCTDSRYFIPIGHYVSKG